MSRSSVSSACSRRSNFPLHGVFATHVGHLVDQARDAVCHAVLTWWITSALEGVSRRTGRDVMV